MINYFAKLFKGSVILILSLCIAVFLIISIFSAVIYNNEEHKDMSLFYVISQVIAKYGWVFAVMILAATALLVIISIYTAIVFIWIPRSKTRRAMADLLNCKVSIDYNIESNTDKYFVFNYNKVMSEIKIYFNDKISYIWRISYDDVMFMYVDVANKRKFSVIVELDKLKDYIRNMTDSNIEYIVRYDSMKDSIINTQSYGDIFIVSHYDYEFDETDGATIMADYNTRIMKKVIK